MAAQWEIKPDTGDGILFWQEEKTSDRAPDARGSITFDKGLLRLLLEEHKAGRELKVEVSGWNRMSRNGKPFTSMSVQMPRQRDANAAPRQVGPPTPAPRAPLRAVPPRDDLDDEIPF